MGLMCQQFIRSKNYLATVNVTTTVGDGEIPELVPVMVIGNDPMAAELEAVKVSSAPPATLDHLAVTPEGGAP